MCMYKKDCRVCVVGDKDSVLPFRVLGVDVFTVLNGNEGRSIVDKLANENYAIIFITEQIASFIPETIERYKGSILPAVILIPNNQGSLNIGLNSIRANVEKAVGVNIL